ncbi:MAG: class C sortase [Oscillospiraceae bacterium]|nr:class C sortase [Oscillospiraceae bacterium]
MNEEKYSEAEETRSQIEEPVKKPKKKKHGGLFSTLLLFALVLVGTGILLYPTFSNWWNSMHATQAIASYTEAVEDLTVKERALMLEAARAYNERLAKVGTSHTLSDAEMAEYRSILDITGTGIMGYIQIPAISVNLPIYHTTAESVLQSAVGHLEGSSLPIGGESTHAALSGHRGLPSARLFTDLDRMREGDVFTITVFDQTVTYMVDQIRIVFPYEVDDLEIEEGADYCTLITCTPYGVNTHRMLVRGVRIENLSDGDIKVVAEANKLPTFYAMFGVGIPLLFILLVILLIASRKRKPKMSYDEILDDLKKS